MMKVNVWLKKEESMMAVTYEGFENWKKRGKEMGATHLISVCDTWDYDDYPVFVMPDDNVDEVASKYCSNMQRVNEIVEL
jgi:hypothetical protein